MKNLTPENLKSKISYHQKEVVMYNGNAFNTWAMVEDNQEIEAFLKNLNENSIKIKKEKYNHNY